MIPISSGYSLVYWKKLSLHVHKPFIVSAYRSDVDWVWGGGGWRYIFVIFLSEFFAKLLYCQKLWNFRFTYWQNDLRNVIKHIIFNLVGDFPFVLIPAQSHVHLIWQMYLPFMQLDFLALILKRLLIKPSF